MSETALLVEIKNAIDDVKHDQEQLSKEQLLLFEERYDLVLSQTALHDPQLQPVLDYLQTAVFRQKVNALNGYDTTHTGAIKNVSS